MTFRAVLAIVIGYGAGIWLSILAIRKGLTLRSAQAWRSAPGTILESATFVDAQKRTHFRIRYEFVGVARTEGDTPRLCGDWFWNNAQQQAFVARYQAGQPVEVYFDPSDPRRNCLDRTDPSGVTALWVLALGGIALGSMLVWLCSEEIWQLLGQG